MADQIRYGAGLLEAMLAPDRPIWDKADEIKEVEHKCDFLTHEIIQRLNRTFVTPLDREDIYALARSLDDVMDAIDASATIVRLYHIDSRAPRRTRAGAASSCDSAEAGGPRDQGARRSARASPSAPSRSTASRTRPTAPTRRPCRRSSRKSSDAIVIIKWKEILDFLEQATDRCEDVANVLEGVVVKHA